MRCRCGEGRQEVMRALLWALLLLLLVSSCDASTVKGSLKKNDSIHLVTLKGSPFQSACLDGSPYGYYFRQGAETSKFIIFHHGGGWCYNVTQCAQRSFSVLGSSKNWANTTSTDYGILSDNPAVNPYLYNWTLAWLWYCDGSSFTSYRSGPVKHGNRELYFRGKRNLMAAADDLMRTKGLDQATDVIIGGSSAGGLATYIHVDYWASVIPANATVRGLADAGWFLDTTSIYGYSTYTPKMHFAYTVWNSSSAVNEDCLAKTGDGWRCIMAQYTYPFIKTPIFMVNSKYDSWQMGNVYDLPCNANLAQCNATELADLLAYGKTFLSTLPPFEKNSEDGMFVDACYTHTQTMTSDNAWTKVLVEDMNGQNVTIADSFEKWYHGGGGGGGGEVHQVIQTCAYPCNPTCP